ncbi:hypothetical protein HOLleu_42075 [Holothuria leucospilota]|uniref:Uncharacterized protein n=1 Tax=Holothuria leucospilota TaxID=206669 RepID=A0A9Q1BCC2_HOLLE|nr:hypothetical protein HOLleu_42075 [Holothuria leucospilota]
MEASMAGSVEQSYNPIPGSNEQENPTNFPGEAGSDERSLHSGEPINGMLMTEAVEGAVSSQAAGEPSFTGEPQGKQDREAQHVKPYRTKFVRTHYRQTSHQKILRVRAGQRSSSDRSSFLIILEPSKSEADVFEVKTTPVHILLVPI